MSKDFTITALTDRNKPDKFGNKTYTVKFAEDERSVFASFKGAVSVGDVKFGDVLDGEYGPRFKSQMREGTSPAPNNNWKPTPAKKSDDERSNDIRWGLTIKEANAYIIANRPSLDADKWSKEVIEYASALYAISDEPVKVQEEPPLQDQLPDDMLDDHGLTAEDLENIPF